MFDLKKIINQIKCKLKKLESSIPLVQVNADWNATTGVAQILNKPVIIPDNTKVFKAAIQTGNASNNILPLITFKNTLNNVNAIILTKDAGSGIYKLTSNGAFVGSLFKINYVSMNANTRLDVVKINNNEILLVNRSLTSPSTAVDIAPFTIEHFQFELY